MRGTDHADNRKCPYVQVYVNGKGPFTFLYDTGATYLTVSSKVAKAAGTAMVFDRGGARDVVSVATLALGGFKANGAWAIVDDSFGVDGVIGFPTLGSANVLIDFQRREMLLSRMPVRMQHAFTLPYTVPGGVDVPAVPMGIGRRTIPMLIDTGDDAYGLELRSNELGDARVTHAPVGAGTVMNGSRSQKTSTTVLVDPVTLGPKEARSAVIAVNDDLPIGDIGYDVLRQFRFEIDPLRHTVTFQPIFRGKVFNIPAAGE